MTTERRERKKDPDGEDFKKTTVSLTHALWRRAKIRAMDESTDLNSVMVAALEAYLRTPRGGS